jgi:hypothetical protein
VNTRRFPFTTVVIAASLAHAPASQGTGNGDSVSVIPNDLTNYQGDRVSFGTDQIVTVERTDHTILDTMCLPANVQLRGGPGYTALDANKATETGTLFQLLRKPQETVEQILAASKIETHPGALSKLLDRLTGKGSIHECNLALLPTPAPKLQYDDFAQNGASSDSVNVTLRISKDALERSPPNRYGLTYGAIAVPFKYHLTGAKELTGSATVGPYLGYRTDRGGLGYGVSFIGFLGASNIAVTTTQNGQSNSSNLAGFSYGVGAIGSVKGNFQLGGVLGFDRVSANAGYQYNGKPWIALELGYSFLQ